jgi:ribokinase
MRTAVVGHVECVEFASVARVPAAGQIVSARSTWTEAAGGGGVAAVQLARLAGECTLYTALGDDEVGRLSRDELESLGVRVVAATRAGEPTRRAFTFVDDHGERTITVIGERIVPHGDDDLPWDLLDEIDGLYFTGGDPAALRHARRARALVATPRADATLVAAGVRLDALVRSSTDAGEQLDPARMDPPPDAVVSTEGEKGGTWRRASGETGHWEPVPLPGPARDTYGAGDSFAATVAFGLGDGRGLQGAVELAAKAGAWKLAGTAPYEHQLTADDL